MHISAVVLSHRLTRLVCTVQPGQSLAARCGQLAAIVFNHDAAVLDGPNIISGRLLILHCRWLTPANLDCVGERFREVIAVRTVKLCEECLHFLLWNRVDAIWSFLGSFNGNSLCSVPCCRREQSGVGWEPYFFWVYDSEIKSGFGVNRLSSTDCLGEDEVNLAAGKIGQPGRVYLSAFLGMFLDLAELLETVLNPDQRCFQRRLRFLRVVPRQCRLVRISNVEIRCFVRWRGDTRLLISWRRIVRRRRIGFW